VRQRFGRASPQSAPGGTANGIEIAAAEGVEVAAVHDGTVAFADTFSGYGRLVIVDHGAQSFTLYGYLLDLAVERGARVERGTTVGRVGTSVAGTPGLYFELRVDGRPVDPLQWLKKR
jgi:septal ring factor EnvC (AmiA/AmiB activator)